MAQSTLSCPKCGGSMRGYERNGIVIDQCQECRGVFLDRGELERLIDAEGRAYGGREYDAPSPRHEKSYDRPYKKKRKGFLGDMFDFD